MKTLVSGFLKSLEKDLKSSKRFKNVKLKTSNRENKKKLKKL